MNHKALNLFVVLLGLLVNSCDLIFDAFSTPEVPDWYPMDLVKDDARMASFDSVWTTFLEENELDLQPLLGSFWVDSVLSRLDFLIDHNKQYQFCAFSGSRDSQKVFNESIARFIDKWYRLVSIEPIHIGQIENRDRSRYHLEGYVYPESYYSYPVYRTSRSSGLGSVRILVDLKGRMIVMQSSLIPQLQVPEETVISKNEAKSKLSGYNYAVVGMGGSVNRVFSTKDIEESALEVYVHRIYENRKPVRLEYYLTWRFRTFDGDFFVDSQTGEIINFFQGWVS